MTNELLTPSRVGVIGVCAHCVSHTGVSALWFIDSTVTAHFCAVYLIGPVESAGLTGFQQSFPDIIL